MGDDHDADKHDELSPASAPGNADPHGAEPGEHDPAPGNAEPGTGQDRQKVREDDEGPRVEDG